MLLKKPTTQQLSDTFESVLASIIAGELDGCPTDTGIDPITQSALKDVANASGKALTGAVEKARRIFMAQGG